MSYLLDALRKSEQERQQKTPVPGLQSSAVEWENSDEGRSRSPWLLVAVVAIVLNTVLLAVLVWRFGFAERASDAGTHGLTTSSAASAAPAPVANNAPAMPAVIVVQQPAATSMTQAPIVVRERREPAVPYSITSQTSTSQISTLQTSEPRQSTSLQTYPMQTAASASEPSAIAGQSSQGSSTTDMLDSGPANRGESFERSAVPSVHSLSAEIRRQLPYLAMNSHIYANNAKDSFVMINGTSFSPGQLVADGLKLVAVVPEGAVLEINGTRFMLPALATFSP